MGSIIISGDTSGTVTLNVASIAGTNTLTLPASNVNVLTDQGGLATVDRGGTGKTSFTAYAPICGGTTSTGAFQSVASLGTAGQALTSNGPGALPSFQSLPSPLFVFTDTTAGTGKTWTIPANGTYALVRCWGGGGSGGRGGATATQAAGGGGGGYAERYYKLSDLGASVSYNVAAGGAAVSAGGVGNAGGNTTFHYANTLYQITAYGGGAGFGNATASGGGGGGGVLGRGGNGGAAVAGTAGSLGGGAGGQAAAGAIASIPWGGSGGGGHGSNPGGNAFLGGGGGGGAHSSLGTGGTSVYGGNGGAGVDTGNAVAGSQPGGGGGGNGANSGNSGKGGDGEIEIWVW